MRLFACEVCSNLLHFENTRCEQCGSELGFLPDAGVVSAMTPQGAAWRAHADTQHLWKTCANRAYDACNWMLACDSGAQYCSSCAHNHTVPDLADSRNLMLWRKVQYAKNRLVYSLDRMGLPHPPRAEGKDTGLAFDILAEAPDPAAPRVMTGHDEGLITLALAEADDAERESRRTSMGEPYRTLLGHFRHEVGHHFWNVLVREAGRLDECRAVFGDERQDYGEALQAHYAKGADDSWRGLFISSYAAAHPWEDWAESWAHYMHIQDSLEMAAAFGLDIRPRLDETGELTTRIRFDPYRQGDFGRIIDAWTPVTIAMNSMNRCMGTPDLYPFVMSDAVVDKLRYIHRLVLEQGSQTRAGQARP